MDPAVAALKRLIGESVKRRVEVADILGFNEQTLYQIANGIPLKSGKPRSVGRKMREALDLHFPGWLADLSGSRAVQSLTPATPSLHAALAVVLARLPGLDEYTAGKVVAAVQAATRPQAPLEAIERDLVQWLSVRPASASPAAPPEKQASAA